MSGPIWIGPLHDPTVLPQISSLLSPTASPTLKTILKQAEFEVPDPLSYDLEALAKEFNTTNPGLKTIAGALSDQDYVVSGSHTRAGVLKTDAGSSAVYDAMRCWRAVQGGVQEDTELSKRLMEKVRMNNF